MQPRSKMMSASLILCALSIAPAADAAEPPKPSFAARMEAAYRQSQDPGLLVLAAEGHAREGNRDKAREWLAKAVEQKADVDVPQTSALGQLRSDPAIARLIETLAARSPGTANAAGERLLEPISSEGIAADPRDGTLFIGDVTHRAILKLDGKGVSRRFGAPLKLPPVGMTVDSKRGLLWVATSGLLAVPEEAGSALLRCEIKSETCQAIAGEPGSINDVVVASADGTLFATDSLLGRVWRVRPGTSRLEQWEHGSDLSFANGIALSKSERTLYVAQGLGPVAIDLATGERKSLRLPGQSSLIGIDGLYRHGSSLIGIQNVVHNGRIVAIDLGDETSVRSIRTLENRAPQFDEPTTGAILGDRLFVIANAQLQPEVRSRPLKPLRIVEYRLSALLDRASAPTEGPPDILKRPSPYERDGPDIRSHDIVEARTSEPFGEVFEAAGSPARFVILVPGAAPGAGDPRRWEPLRSWARMLAREGINAVIPSLPEADTAERRKRLNALASQLIKQRSDARICLFAMSAGGLVLIPAAQDRDLNCRVGLYPLLTGSPPVPGPQPKEVPLLIVRAGADSAPGITAGIDQALARALQSDQPVELVNVPGAGHAFDLGTPTAAGRRAIDRIFEYLRYHLGQDS